MLIHSWTRIMGLLDRGLAPTMDMCHCSVVHGGSHCICAMMCPLTAQVDGSSEQCWRDAKCPVRFTSAMRTDNASKQAAACAFGPRFKPEKPKLTSVEAHRPGRWTRPSSVGVCNDAASSCRRHAAETEKARRVAPINRGGLARKRS
jgi:hypothetical protein